MSEGPTFYRVTQNWTRSYPDPVTVKAGDHLHLNGRTYIWDGYQWLWAANDAGHEGWVPDTLVARADRNSAAPRLTTALFDYSAQELTCQGGDVLTVSKATNGWMWCRTTGGHAGWVSQAYLVPA